MRNVEILSGQLYFVLFGVSRVFKSSEISESEGESSIFSCFMQNTIKLSFTAGLHRNLQSCSAEDTCSLCISFLSSNRGSICFGRCFIYGYTCDRVLVLGFSVAVKCAWCINSFHLGRTDGWCPWSQAALCCI